MAPFNPTEGRRKNMESGLTPSRTIIDNARMHRALVEIRNKTRSQMDDAQFRAWAQDAAAAVVDEIGRKK